MRDLKRKYTLFESDNQKTGKRKKSVCLLKIGMRQRDKYRQ